MYFDVTGLILAALIGMALLGLLLTAHLGWLIALWETRLSKPFPTWTSRLWLLMAALTPLVGFYALRLADRLRGQIKDRPATEWWRWLLPVLSAGLLALAALRQELRYIVRDRDLGHALNSFGLYCAWFLFAVLVVQMAALVFNATQRGWLTSRSQLLVAALFLATALI